MPNSSGSVNRTANTSNHSETKLPDIIVQANRSKEKSRGDEKVRSKFKTEGTQESQTVQTVVR